MSRFASFQYAPSETRWVLRTRFANKLRVEHQHRFLNPEFKITPDELGLRFLTGLKISSNAEWSNAEITYAALKPSVSEFQNIQALADEGWLRRIWGRVKVGQDLRLAVNRAAPGVMDAYKNLISNIHTQCYVIDGAIHADPDLSELVETVETSGSHIPQLSFRTPEWIAARLWEKNLENEITPEDALRRWVDLWSLLQYPSLVPGVVWGAKDVQVFRETAFRTIEEEPGLGGWNETRNLYVKQLALSRNAPLAVIDSQIPYPPDTMVGRALWSLSNVVEGSSFESLDSCGDLFGLLRLLLADADDESNSPAPHPVVAKIIDLSTDRAELFIYLLYQFKAHSKLLADLLIYPPSAAIACLLIAQWRSPTSGWDRDLTARDNRIDQADAFMDAVSILGEHLRSENTNASEAAALFNWLHDQAGPGFVDDVVGSDSLVSTFRRELSNCTESIFIKMVQSLYGSGVNNGLRASEFAAVLDLIHLGNIEEKEEVDVNAIVSAYANSIATGGYSLSAHRIGASAAAALARMANRQSALRKLFLYPLDIRAKLAAVTPQDNEYSIEESIGRSLRIHIRILCRAIIGESVDVPEDLFVALVSTVRAGALQHKAKGRVAAFSPRFEKQILVPTLDRPLATDLAAALTHVDRQRQERLLAALLETDEPLILAQLLTLSPATYHLDIKRRINEIAPIDAGSIHALPEMQSRIEGLLKVGAADAAESYMAAEAELKTLGVPPGRELNRFRNQLQLHFVRENWAAISSTPNPNFTAPLEQQAAVEILEQFRGLVAVKGPNPNPTLAKSIFAKLFDKRPSIVFLTNWFAAEISGLLQADSFSLLSKDQIRRGQKAITEVERLAERLPDGSFDEAFECNRAQLLLALGEPSQALGVLSVVTFTRLQDIAAAHRAIALARLGRLNEATATLDSAEIVLGRTPILTAARSHIANGAQFNSAPNLSVYEDLTKNVATEFSRFRLMNPDDQARVIQHENDSLETLLIDYVRAAADSVVSLVPMMKGVQIDAIEDDLNAFIQHLLGARIQILGWSTAGDQSKGGFTDKGNAGERDILVTWGNSVLTLIEAVICDRPLTQDAMRANLESHFQKLLGYGNPKIFFHLTYAYIDDKKGLMASLERSAETASPPGFDYIGREPIPHTDSRPPGFVARYSADFGELKVVFLILNLGQQLQRLAAKTAAATKTRKAPKKPKRKL